MAQHDQVIDNGPGLAVRTDINQALAALFSSSSGTVEPSVNVPGQLWFNTSTGRLQVRNAADTAWEAISKYMGGTITLDSAAIFTGTSTGVGNALVGVQDARVTTGAEGNAVLAVNRQNSATPALMFGNDANNAGLIGGNNSTLRFGKWVSGVFTEYMNIDTAGTITVPTGAMFQVLGTNNVIVGGTAAALEVQGSAPSIKLTDTTASAYDFFMHVDGQNFHVLVDRTGDGSYETPHPLQLEGDTNVGYVFGSKILVATDYAEASTGSKLAMRDANGDINARLFRSEYDTTNSNIGYFMTQVNTGTDNYIRPSTPAQAAAELSGLVNAGTLDGIDSTGFARFYTGSNANETNYPIGTVLMVALGDGDPIIRNASYPVYYGASNHQFGVVSGTQLSGTWRARGDYDSPGSGSWCGLVQRVA